ncbi:hypothetical protein AMTR_s00066p00082890 [Amborella trichopoda]|uniref:Uncharacterized protein n=1 Tax=Amborella trichopoda TaxID=13333 RepID=U5DFC1_AMBTC|nr:hypothetical protein AMTR_s00066p00082890 [Amborella trichopoda]
MSRSTARALCYIAEANCWSVYFSAGAHSQIAGADGQSVQYHCRSAVLSMSEQCGLDKALLKCTL